MKKTLLIVSITVLVILIGLAYYSFNSTALEFQTCTIVEAKENDSLDFTKLDSVTIIPSTLYEGGRIKRLMQGENYRKAWSTPVKVPILYLDTLFGGMKIIEQGGGMQTHSLELEDTLGIRYSLRSVNKNLEQLIPAYTRLLGIQNVVVDDISSQHPLGALVVAKLADVAGILHTHPRLVFVPKQTILDTLNEKFGNRIFLLEYETEGDITFTSHHDTYKILDTKDLQELKMKHPEKVSIDERALVRVRLFDMIIGDWDRHAQQWGWVVRKNQDNYFAIPLPGDRDYSFYKANGIIPFIFTNRLLNKRLRPYRKNIDYLAGLVDPFDAYFLYKTPEEIFIEEARQLQTVLTDEEIFLSFQVWPPEIYRINAAEIAEKIIARRDNLVEYAKEFRQVLDEQGPLNEPLRDSEKIVLSDDLKKCFACTN